ncbi:hypothetical protein BRDID11002_13510 [Bradyrhizobium diazoefficiens]
MDAGPLKLRGAANQLGGRGADREADAHAGYGKGIFLTPKEQNTFATADADDEAALGEHDCHLSGLGTRRRAEAGNGGGRSNQDGGDGSVSHDFRSPLA